VTAGDHLRSNTEETATFYSDLGFPHVRHRIVEGSGHCGFPTGWDGLDVYAEGLDYVDPQANAD
jgi:hypothetical protein